MLSPRLDEPVLGVEQLVKRGFARSRRGDDLIDADGIDPVTAKQPGGSFDQPIARRGRALAESARLGARDIHAATYPAPNATAIMEWNDRSVPSPPSGRGQS